MRLVRLARQPSRVAEDIRAALASLGRGTTEVGGIALIGARPLENEPPLDAVVVLPHGVLTVIGVDLPDPAMRLEAPLRGQWKADGWPLVHADDAINPASKALAISETVARKLGEAHPSVGTVGTVVAVGPFVDSVEQPAADLIGTVRVLHPTPTSMLAATVSLASSDRRRSVAEARALLRTLSPDAPEQSDEILLAEGFSAETEHPSVVMPPAPAPEPCRVQAPRPRRPSAVRWLPIGAMALLAVLLISAILAAGGGDRRDGGTAPTSLAAPPRLPAASQRVEAVQFTRAASGADQRCASHGFGDVQSSLQRTSCNAVWRGSFSAKIDGRPAAVTVARVEFADARQAQDFKAIADMPGGGGIIDIAAETGKWPGAAPRFEGGPYTSSLDGSSVRLVRAVWVAGPSTADDPGLSRAAKSALELPLTE